MTRLLEPFEHIAQAIVRLFAGDGVTYRVHQVEPGDGGTLITIEAVSAGKAVLVTVRTIE